MAGDPAPNLVCIQRKVRWSSDEVSLPREGSLYSVILASQVWETGVMFTHLQFV